MRPVGIIGIGMVPMKEAIMDRRLEEIIFEAASAALKDAGIDRSQVDNVVIAASDELDGRSISSMLTAAPAGAYLKDEIKVTDDGAFALTVGAMRILSGIFDVSLVVSWNKTSEIPIDSVMRMRFDPFFHRGLGLNHVTTTALLAHQYKQRYGLEEDIPAQIVVNNRKNALQNKNAHLREEISINDVLNSNYVAYPIREKELAPLSDGAVAMVIASEKTARKLNRHDKLVTLKGFGWALDSYYLGERDITRWVSLETATAQAMKHADIKGINEIDVFECNDQSPYHELITLEGLGLSDYGKGANLVRSGEIAINGGRPVNPSGGAISSNPYFCTGLIRVAEAYLQAAGRAGGHQIDGVRTALAQSTNGFAGQGNSVFIVGEI
jgi:acetyl-CoA acetyltransferase